MLRIILAMSRILIPTTRRAVFEALVYANKVPENRVQLLWTGERLPFISAADDETESRNRMAAIIIVSDATSARCGG
jgi:hypothetical protein